MRDWMERWERLPGKMRGEIWEGKKEVKGGGTSQTVSIRPRGEGQDVCGRRGFNCGNLLLLIFSVSIFNILHPLTAYLCLPLCWSDLQLLQLRPHLLIFLNMLFCNHHLLLLVIHLLTLLLFLRTPTLECWASAAIWQARDSHILRTLGIFANYNCQIFIFTLANNIQRVPKKNG